MHPDILDSLTRPPPDFPTSGAERVAKAYFGIRAEARPLVSDKDQNFRLEAKDGSRYLLKIANSAESKLAVDFQNAALRHVAEQDAALPVPRVLTALDGRLHVTVNNGANEHIVRVLSWLDGIAMQDISGGDNPAYALGELLARLGLALRGFDHSGSNPPGLWDMKRANQLRELLPHVADADMKVLIERGLDQFESEVQPLLLTLRSQVIYNDLNPGNVLLDEDKPNSISGIIDFGDLIKSPLIVDLAVASAYQLTGGDDPLAGALPLIEGYHAVCPLQPLEMTALMDLIRTRLITSLVINAYRRSLFPENREYLMVSHAEVSANLAGLDRLKAKDARERIAAVCKSTVS